MVNPATILSYVKETALLAKSPNVTESTYYPAIKNLISAILKENRLPFDVRVNTSEKNASANNMPDFVLGKDSFVSVYGEVKPPNVNLEELAASIEQKDQIGRYLLQTGVVIVCNVRGFGLLACKAGYERPKHGSVPPDKRVLIKTVDVWSAISGNQSKVDDQAVAELLEVFERALTDYAPLADPLDLARVLARQARDARLALPADLKPVKPLLDDYHQALGLSFDINDDKGDRFFRSSLVQTAFYSLFAAWVLWDKSAKAGDNFDIDDATTYLPIPFLNALLHDIRHPKRLKALGLEEHIGRAIATLNRVDRDIFRTRMTFPTIEEQTSTAAITYFYEPFLEAFDPKLREELGVWYTPPEIVRYQVRRIHHILKTELDRPRGLADPDVVILDPCCGTGAYLLEVARCISDEAKATGDESAIGLEVTQAFHERVIGFEILTAPFAVAQLQLFIFLDSLGATPDPDKRLAIFLTNALSGWHAEGNIKLTFPEMREEFDASQDVKRNAKIIVVVGNPPYDGYAGVAQSEEAELVAAYKGVQLVDDYDAKTKQVKRDVFGSVKKKPSGKSQLYLEYGVRKQMLDDLYVRFFRMAEERIGEAAEYGIISYISNSSYLTGRSHPIMRKSLLTNFDIAFVDNLNGDKYRTGKLIPADLPNAGTADQSAFTTDMDSRGIQPGTAIATFVKRNAPKTEDAKAVVWYRDFWGLANQKRADLLAELPSGSESGKRPYLLANPTRDNRWRLSPTMVEGGFEAWPSLEELFPANFQGVQPSRGLEGTVVDTSRKALKERVEKYFSASTYKEAAALYPEFATHVVKGERVKRARYDAEAAWKTLKGAGHFNDKAVKKFVTFPFDLRYLYYSYDEKWLNEARREFFENLSDNEFFACVFEPRKRSEVYPYYSTHLTNYHLHERGCYVFPRQTADALGGAAYANLSDAAWRTLGVHFGLTEKQAATGPTSVRQLTVSRDSDEACSFVGQLFRVGFAILHAPAYQKEHKSALSADWAHLPIPKDAEVFNKLVQKGEQITRLLDASRDASDIVETVLGKDCAARIGSPKRTDGANLTSKDLKITINYWGGSKGGWVARSFAFGEAPLEEWGEGVWGESTGDLYINEGTFFSHVPEAVWTYQLGGYPVLKKWLGYRQADRREEKPLTDAERKWFRQVIQRVAALLALGCELDKLYQSAIVDAFTAAELGIER